MNLFSLLSVTFQQADKGRKRTLRTADSLLYVKITIQGLEFRRENEISRKCAVICKVIYFYLYNVVWHSFSKKLSATKLVLLILTNQLSVHSMWSQTLMICVQTLEQMNRHNECRTTLYL